MLTAWKNPHAVPSLQPGQVQLWRCDVTILDLAALLQLRGNLLTEDERMRAERMRVTLARDEFIAGRMLLRTVLNAHLGTNLPISKFDFGPNGKPYLKATPELDFNVSHSGGMVLVAVSRAGSVGIDVEFVDNEFSRSGELLEIARAALHGEEFDAIRAAVTEREQLLQFYRAWTRKEAVAKADGRGIADSLAYTVSGSAEDGGSRVVLTQPHGGGVPYYVQETNASAYHIAAIATLHEHALIACFEGVPLLL